MTQEQIVKNRLHETGYIDNIWCINRRILRLGAIICRLKKKGYEFRRYMPPDKNCHYYLLKKDVVATINAMNPYKEKVEIATGLGI